MHQTNADIVNRLFQLVPNPFERRQYITTYRYVPRRHSAYATVPGKQKPEGTQKAPVNNKLKKKLLNKKRSDFKSTATTNKKKRH